MPVGIHLRYLYHLPYLSKGISADGFARSKWATAFDTCSTKTTFQLAIIHPLKVGLQDTSNL